MHGPDYYEFLARGYAWGRSDAVQGGVAGTEEGIQFGLDFRAYLESDRARTFIPSVQNAYASWKGTGKIV